ncbi:hypothetical protein [Actinopolymorpha alba]|uniref:hypothetical protein n=1 Tax=Actinopolymorpha alba TaxID=533267 RepID=UPI00192B7FB4|nr:hypothetical protein [Actinopolymorpha alba]
MPGSRRYADPASFLLIEQAWAPQRVEFCSLVGKPADGVDALAKADNELHTALGDLEALLAKGAAGEIRLTDDGALIIPPLTAEDIPADDVPRTERRDAAPLAAGLGAGGGRRPDRVHRPPGARRGPT